MSDTDLTSFSHCSLCDKPKGDVRMVAGETGMLICVSCVNAARRALKKDDRDHGDYPMPITKPLKWGWTSGNVLSIYEPSEHVEGGRIYLQLWEDIEDGSWEYDSRPQMEATATFVCDVINHWLGQETDDADDEDEDTA